MAERSKNNQAFQAPMITREPASRQAKLGARVVLRVQASARPAPTYQWFHNGRKITGANSSELEIASARRLSAGHYHCEVRNHLGRAASKPCTLSFFTATLPKLALSVSELAVEEGKELVLKLEAPEPGAFRGLKFFWLRNGARVPGAHGPELRVPASQASDAGEYKAMCAVGSEIETSNVCRVTVLSASGEALVPAEEIAGVEEIVATAEETAPAPASESAAFFNPAGEEEPEEMLLAMSLAPPEAEAPVESVAEEFVKEVTKKIVAPPPLPSPMDVVQAAHEEEPMPAPSEPAPHLGKKKRFLEGLLSRWQRKGAEKQQAA